MPDITLQQLLMRFLGLLVIAGIHGFSLALASRAFGDRGPGYDGRLTLNPVVHMDAAGSIVLLLFGFGWTKPIDLDPGLLRYKNFGPAIIAGLGLGAIALLVAVLYASRPLAFAIPSETATIWLSIWFGSTIQLATAFLVFNLLPFPPLAASLAIHAFIPKEHVSAMNSSLWPRLLLALAIVTGVALGPFRSLIDALRL